MEHLKYLLLLLLSSFSLQDDENCLALIQQCYEPNANGPITNCLYYQSENSCLECEPGYALSYDQLKCEKFDENCQFFSKNRCGFCKPGYALTLNSTCLQSDNCSYFLDYDNIKCRNCIRYFHPDENYICQKTFCKQYDIFQPDVCETCQNGYILNKNTKKCEKKSDPYCEEFEEENGEGDCISCIDGYYLDENTKKCKKINIPYCVELDEEDPKKCKECVKIFTLNENGDCVYPPKLIPNCIKYNNNGECIDCFGLYDEEKKTCTISKCNGKIINRCAHCKLGYYLDYDGTCMGYDGTKDTHPDSNSDSNSSSNSNKIQHSLSLLILILTILV